MYEKKPSMVEIEAICKLRIYIVDCIQNQIADIVWYLCQKVFYYQKKSNGRNIEKTM